MGKLVMWDDAGEPWLDNPHLLIGNPRRKRGRKMAKRKRYRRNFFGPPEGFDLFGDGPARTPRRRKKGRSKMAKRRQPAALRAYWAKKRGTRRRKRSFSGASSTRFAKRFRRHKSYGGTLRSGNRRGRVRFKFNRRRHYRSNPGSSVMGLHLPFGLSVPPVKDIAFGVAGLIVPGMVTAKLMTFIPASFSGNQIVTWLVKVASVLVPGMLIKKYVGPSAGYAFLIGGAASLAIDAIRTFVPSMAATIGLGAQPLLGYYPGGQLQGYLDRKPKQIPRTSTPVLTGVPERLNPGSRF